MTLAERLMVTDIEVIRRGTWFAVPKYSGTNASQMTHVVYIVKPGEEEEKGEGEKGVLVQLIKQMRVIVKETAPPRVQIVQINGSLWLSWSWPGRISGSFADPPRVVKAPPATAPGNLSFLSSSGGLTNVLGLVEGFWDLSGEHRVQGANYDQHDGVEEGNHVASVYVGVADQQVIIPRGIMVDGVGGIYNYPDPVYQQLWKTRGEERWGQKNQISG